MKRILILMYIFIAASCSTTNSNKDKYVGQWKAIKSNTTISIYEENNSLFVKWPNGELLPLKFQEEGLYYEMATVFGSLPLIIKNDTLKYSQSKYIKIAI